VKEKSFAPGGRAITLVCSLGCVLTRGELIIIAQYRNDRVSPKEFDWM